MEGKKDVKRIKMQLNSAVYLVNKVKGEMQSNSDLLKYMKLYHNEIFSQKPQLIHNNELKFFFFFF